MRSRDNQLSPVFTYYHIKQEEKKRKRTHWAGGRRPHTDTIKELAHACQVGKTTYMIVAGLEIKFFSREPTCFFKRYLGPVAPT